MGENQRAKGLENLEEDLGAVNLLKRGAQTHPFKNLIKAMDLLFLEKSTLLCVWCAPNDFTHSIRGLKDPCNLATQSLRIHRLFIIDPSLIPRTYMAQTQCSLIRNRTKSLSLRVPEGSRQAQKGTCDQKQHIFYHNQAQLGLSLPEPGFPYSSLILSLATQQIPKNRHTLLALLQPSPPPIPGHSLEKPQTQRCLSCLYRAPLTLTPK